MTGERSSAKAAWLGALWGLGHTLTLLAAGACWSCCGPRCQPSWRELFELCVVLLLVGSGVRAIHQGARQGPEVRRTPTQAGAAFAVGPMDSRTATPVGAVHGLAAAAHSPRSWSTSPVDGDAAGPIWRCSASDRPWAWSCSRVYWAGRSHGWERITCAAHIFAGRRRCVDRAGLFWSDPFLDGLFE